MSRYSYSSTNVARSGASTTSFNLRNSSSKGDFSSRGDFSGQVGVTEKTVPDFAPHDSDIEAGNTTQDEVHSKDTDDRNIEESSNRSPSDSGDDDLNINPQEGTVELKDRSEALTNRDQSVKFTSESFVAPTQQRESTGRSLISWLSSRRGNLDSNEPNDRQSRNRRGREVAKSKSIAVQGLLYVGAFYITWFFPTMSRITELVAKKNYFPIQFLDTFLIPLQGFLNFVIYIRPRYLKLRRENEEDGFWKTFKTAVVEIKID